MRAIGRDAQQVVLDDVAVGARAVVLDGVDVVADDVAVGEVGRADVVVVGARVEHDREVAGLRRPVAAGAREADPVADDAVVVGVDAVEQDAPVEVVHEQATDGVAGAGDEQADFLGAAAVAAELDARDGVGAELGGVDATQPGWL